jgi:hypothetical protein
METVMDQLTLALGVSGWDGPIDLPQYGVAVAIAIDAGIEIVSPLSDDSAAAEHIRVHGEGVYTFCFGVADIEAAVDRAAAAGVPRSDAPIIDSLSANGGQPFFAGWDKRFRVVRELWLGPIAGMRIVLGQFEPLLDDATGDHPGDGGSTPTEDDS